MSLFKVKIGRSDRDISAFESIARARSYFLYRRKPDGVWYAGFRIEGERHYKRLSTRARDRAEADRFVRSHLALTAEVDVDISAFGVERMIERARLRAKKKKLPFALNASCVRAALAHFAFLPMRPLVFISRHPQASHTSARTTPARWGTLRLRLLA